MGLIPISNWIIYWDACFLDLGIIFLDPYMYFGPGRIFFDLGAQKMWGTCLCVFLTRLGYFFWTCNDLHVFVLDPGNFFTTAKLIVSDLGFCFLDPCTCFVDLASIGVRGRKLHCYMRLHSHWAGCFWTLALFFLTCTCFFGPGAGWGEFRYWDKIHVRKCWEKGGTCRYWSQMIAEHWWERGRWRGEVRHRNKMSAVEA